jgi:hypothetical protein
VFTLFSLTFANLIAGAVIIETMSPGWALAAWRSAKTFRSDPHRRCIVHSLRPSAIAPCNPIEADLADPWRCLASRIRWGRIIKVATS